MQAHEIFVVVRPLKNGKCKRVSAWFTRGEARQKLVPNFDDRVEPAVLLTEVPENTASIASWGHRMRTTGKYCCNLPKPAKPAKKKSSKKGTVRRG